MNKQNLITFKYIKKSKNILENPLFVLAIFINASKVCFWSKKKFKFHARVQKCHFGKIEKLPKWHF